MMRMSSRCGGGGGARRGMSIRLLSVWLVSDLQASTSFESNTQPDIDKHSTRETRSCGLLTNTQHLSQIPIRLEARPVAPRTTTAASTSSPRVPRHCRHHTRQQQHDSSTWMRGYHQVCPR
ncbi:hypothetical protein K504DRAFT_257532 [Pleomassaria siparia CBS 279.74]|uniref:Secreted protein n=1 Tax=Pleomassaria siparia CBS 279.74 TaxID=1314801 RepID=A0A6G1KBP2_9PLEO|nr:hypothetical protein K504DRAFT_257532 [Pleomassaria siparia CBS 279.74]